MTPIELLRNRHPWPAEKPDIEPLMHGWFNGADDLPQFLSDNTRIIIEVGSWLGQSARWFLRNAPNAHVICIDHWKGSEEHQDRDDTRELLPDLYERFLVNMWDYRDRVTPVKNNSASGMMLCQVFGVVPDLVYIDASHDKLSVFYDLLTALRCFPNAQVTGDDYDRLSVADGVLNAVGAFHLPPESIRHSRKTWWIDRGTPSASHPECE